MEFASKAQLLRKEKSLWLSIAFLEVDNLLVEIIVQHVST